MRTLTFGMVKTRAGSRRRMTGLMLAADVIGLVLAVLLGHWLAQDEFHFGQIGQEELQHVVMTLCFLALLVSSRLYPGTGINPTEEIRLVSQYALASSLIGVVILKLLQLDQPNLLTLLLSGMLGLILVLGLRWVTRIVAVLLGLWKEPVLVVARGEQAATLVRRFRAHLRFGYWPSVVATDAAGIEALRGREDETVILLEDLAGKMALIEELGIETGLIDLACAAEVLGPSAGHGLAQALPHLIVLSDLGWLGGASIHPHDYEGTLGVEVRRNQLDTLDLALKNVLDRLGSALGLVLVLPVLAVIALAVKLDSPGPVFYTQERLGKGWRKFRILKFRTMVRDADACLRAYLEANPAAQREWDEKHKLTVDPRITRVGGFLRKFSLDELPQLVNVLKGELSLVGARPIVQAETSQYGDQFEVYIQFKPGLTGLWQVSGRSDTTFEERVRYDVYYVHNWSIWLDLYILLRTVWVVFSRAGAY